MTPPCWLLPALLLAGCSAAPAQPAPEPAPQADRATGPVVVELYQSQGCSSCPPAIRNLNAMADDPNILALTFAVTYWDDLGWKDTFASPAFTARQWDYARAGNRDKVYTPQMIVNGSAALVGSNPAQVKAALAAAAPLAGPALGLAGGRLTVAARAGAVQAEDGPAIVWLVRYTPMGNVVKIGRGENSGRTLDHRNIVTGMTALGDWTGQAASFALPRPVPGEAQAVIVQAGTGGPVVAAKKL